MRPVVLASESWETPTQWPPWSGDAVYADTQWWPGPDTYSPGTPPHLALADKSPSTFLNITSSPTDEHRGNRFVVRFPEIVTGWIFTELDVYSFPSVLDPMTSPPVRVSRPNAAFYGSVGVEHLGGSRYRVRALVPTASVPTTDLWVYAYSGSASHVYSMLVGEDTPDAPAGVWPLRQRQSLIGAGSWPVRQRQSGGHPGSWPLRQRQDGT